MGGWLGQRSAADEKEPFLGQPKRMMGELFLSSLKSLRRGSKGTKERGAAGGVERDFLRELRGPFERKEGILERGKLVREHGGAADYERERGTRGAMGESRGALKIWLVEEAERAVR